MCSVCVSCVHVCEWYRGLVVRCPGPGVEAQKLLRSFLVPNVCQSADARSPHGCTCLGFGLHGACRGHENPAAAAALVFVDAGASSAVTMKADGKGATADEADVHA